MDIVVPQGYRFAGVHVGVKRDPAKLDLALVASSPPASGAGVFTTNRLSAAPVQACRRRLPAPGIHGIVINSGNANACTGDQGRDDAELMAALLAGHLHCSKDKVLVCSTGVIGRLLPMEKLTAGIPRAAEQLESGPEAITRAAQGILTTDSGVKITSREISLPSGTARILGFAKGAAMIGPMMATTLGFILTDAVASPTLLDSLLRRAIDKSFHCISVEGHTSTNDTVLILANGASGVIAPEESDSPFAEAVNAVAMDLAQMVARDAEGATHFVTIDVVGARTDADARKIAKAVADSPLVKTAIYGHDPNWGRICSAAGYAGVEFDEHNLSLSVNGTLLYDKGRPTAFDPATESARMKASRDTDLVLTLSLGPGKCRFWTCDLTVEYVRFNADYTT